MFEEHDVKTLHLTPHERKEIIRIKEKELQELRKLDFEEGFKENRLSIFMAGERLAIMVVSMICFTLHSVSTPDEEELEHNAFSDRVLQPMAYGADMLMQAGFCIVYASIVFINVIVLIIVDLLAAVLLIAVFCLIQPGTLRGMSLALFTMVLLDIVLHGFIVSQEFYILCLQLREKKREKRSSKEPRPSSGEAPIAISHSTEETRRDSMVRFPEDTSDTDKRSRPESRRSSAKPRGRKFSLLEAAEERAGNQQKIPQKKSLITLAAEREIQQPNQSKPKTPSATPSPPTVGQSEPSERASPRQPTKSDTPKLQPAVDQTKPTITRTPKQNTDASAIRKQSVVSTESRKPSTTSATTPAEPKKSTTGAGSAKSSAPVGIARRRSRKPSSGPSSEERSKRGESRDSRE